MKNSIKERIKNITNNLKSTTGLIGKFNPPQSISERMDFYSTPGVSIAVINNYNLEFSAGFGMSDIENSQPVTNEILFQAGSISKPIFALAVMRLVQEGLIDLDKDINQYLSIPFQAGTGNWQPMITMRQLLSHTAGLTVHGFEGYQVAESIPEITQILNGEAPSNTERVEVNILPGTSFRYSGGGTTLAQHVLVDLLKKPFPQILKELVFEPLNLRSSSYEQPLSSNLMNSAAKAYPWKNQMVNGGYHIYPEMAAAGLWTTPIDLATIGLELMKVLQQLNESSLLSKETIELMLTPQLSNQIKGKMPYYGLGFYCSGKDEQFYFGHQGWNVGFVSDIRFYPNTGCGVVVMLNSNEGFPMMDEIVRAVAEEYKWPRVSEKEKPVILHNLDAYSGSYKNNDGLSFNLTPHEDHLLFQYEQQSPMKIYPLSELNFYSEVVNTTFIFEKNESEKVSALTVNQVGGSIRVEKDV